MLSRAGMARLCSSSVPQPDRSTAPRPRIAASTRRRARRGFGRDRTPAGRPSGTTGSLSLERHSTLVTLSESRPDQAVGWPCRFGRVSTGPDAAGTPAQAVWDAASAEALHPAARETLLAALDKGYADPRRLHGAGSVRAAAAGQRPRGGRVLPRRASRRGVLHRQRDRGRAPRAAGPAPRAGAGRPRGRPHRRGALLGAPTPSPGPARPTWWSPSTGRVGWRRRTSLRRSRAPPSRSRSWPCRAPTTRWARSSRWRRSRTRCPAYPSSSPPAPPPAGCRCRRAGRWPPRPPTSGAVPRASACSWSARAPAGATRSPPTTGSTSGWRASRTSPPPWPRPPPCARSSRSATR